MTAVVKIFRPEQSGPEDSPTVQQIVDLFLAHRRGGNPSANKDRVHVLTLFCRAFGQRVAIDLCPDDLEDWLARQPRLKSAWSRRRWCGAVKAAMNWACNRRRLIPYNPFAAVSVRPGKRGRPLTEAEFKAILREATDQRFRRFVLFLRYSGCRPGEAAQARWDNLDLERRVIKPDHWKTEHVTSEAREIYLSAQAVRLLILIARTDKVSDHIFVNAWGNPWAQPALSGRMRRIREVAGIPADAKLYGCRHKLATDAILAGVDIATLAQLLGHKGTRTTSWYVHLAGKDEHLQSAIDRVNKRRT